jgi:UDPglucose 6-dehydrogenase
MATVKGNHPQLLQAVMDINQFQREVIVNKLRELLDGDLKGKIIGLLGLAFKENTDDMREAPSITVANLLLEAGATVKGYDPVAMKVAEHVLPNVCLCKDAYELAAGCDALVVVTPWNEFKSLDLERIQKSMRQSVVVDGRNIYEPDRMNAMGFRYRGVGRGYNGQHEVEVAVDKELWAKGTQ